MEPVTWSSGGSHLFLDPRQQGRHRAPIRWRVVEQAVAGLREQHGREVLALRRAEPLERRCALLRRLRTVLAPVDPDPGHSHLLQEGNRVEPGGLQLPGDLRLLLRSQWRRWRRVLPGELAPLLLLAGYHRRGVGERGERDAVERAN